MPAVQATALDRMVAITCSQDASGAADFRTWGLRRAVQSSRLVSCADIVRGVLVASEALPGNAYEVYDMELGFYFFFCKNK